MRRAETNSRLTRRQFAFAGALAGAAAAIGCRAVKGGNWDFLSDEHARTLAALCDQMIPADDFPSASEAGVAHLHRPPTRTPLPPPSRRLSRRARKGRGNQPQAIRPLSCRSRPGATTRGRHCAREGESQLLRTRAPAHHGGLLWLAPPWRQSRRRQLAHAGARRTSASRPRAIRPAQGRANHEARQRRRCRRRRSRRHRRQGTRDCRPERRPCSSAANGTPPPTAAKTICATSAPPCSATPSAPKTKAIRVSGSTQRARLTPCCQARAAYQNNAACVGGGTLSYGAQAWRYLPQDFSMRSTYGAPAGSSLEDWPISYDDLEPFYEKAEYEIGVSGDYSGTSVPRSAPHAAAHAAASSQSRIRHPRACRQTPRPSSVPPAHAAQQRAL